MKTLDLSYNKINGASTLHSLANLKLRHISLVGNPLCESIEQRSIFAILPSLKTVDGVTLSQLTKQNKPKVSHSSMKRMIS